MFLFILELKKPLVEVNKHRKDVKRKPTHPEYCDYYDQHFDNLKEKKEQIIIDVISYFDFFFKIKTMKHLIYILVYSCICFKICLSKMFFLVTFPFLGFFHIDNMIKNYFLAYIKSMQKKGPNGLNYTWRYQMCFLDERVQGF